MVLIKRCIVLQEFILRGFDMVKKETFAEEVTPE